MSDTLHSFQRVTPDFIMDAVETQGFRCDCRTLALNSYENRVYRWESRMAAGWWRSFTGPGRWSDDQIREEHQFSNELA